MTKMMTCCDHCENRFMMERLIELYRKYKGEDPAATEKMAGAGSNRSYFRIIGQTVPRL